MSSETLPVLGGISLTGAVIGFLGGRANQVLVSSVSPVGYSIAFGLTPLETYGIYSLLTNKVNDVASLIFSPIAGYMLSVAVANSLGCEVSLIGPFMGTVSLVGSALLVSLVAVPLIVGAGILYFCLRR